MKRIESNDGEPLKFSKNRKPPVDRKRNTSSISLIKFGNTSFVINTLIWSITAIIVFFMVYYLVGSVYFGDGAIK